MESFKKKEILYACLLALSLIFFGVSIVNAATLYFSPSSGFYKIGRSFTVSIYVSSTDQAINASSGEISFPQEKLELVSLSKTGSIFNLWVQEPAFSNITGTITFEGIVLNPGFQGSAGKIITVNFKGKSAGTASLDFSSGSVLANDGKGTQILTSMGSGNYKIQPTIITPSPAGAPAAPEINSPTHLNSEKWYSNNNPKFTWEVPEDVTGVKLLVNQEPVSIPTVFYSEPITEKQLEDLADGVWYFHTQLRNKFGWGGVSHFKFQIDTQPPESFEIEIEGGKETINPQPTLFFETTDEPSGIDYYEIKINKEEPVRVEKGDYKLPQQSLGKHTIIVKAVDKAGNSILSMTEINILPIEAPIITDYPQTLLPGATLTIKGTSVPEAIVKVYIQKGKEEVAIEETRSDKEGSWTFVGTKPLEKGIYKVWTETIDSLGVRSNPSEKVTIQVTPPVFIRIGELAIDYLTTVITLLVLILVIVLVIIFGWRKIRQRRKRLRKEITEAEKALYQAFKTLKEETEEQITKLDGRPDLSEREKQICDNLKEALKNSEKFIGKEIKDIEKELEQ